MPESESLAAPLAYARAYARIGWRVFPVEPGAKHPIGKLVPRGMLDATLDAEVIGHWWGQRPNAGIGVSLAPSGLVALDIDPRNGGSETFDALQAEHGSLHSNVMAFTGGGGEHHVFVVPSGLRVSLPGTLGPGVDVKANGYIVVEPSIHPSGKPYAWEASSNPLEGEVPSPLPDWLRSYHVALAKPRAEEGSTPVDPAAARDAREALYMLDAEDRDNWLRAGMALHSTGWGHPSYAMWCAWSQQSDKFDSTDQRKTWESFKTPEGARHGLTLAWIFGQAQAAGWVNPKARIASAERIGEEESRSQDDALQILTLEQLRAQARSVSWLVKHTIPAESLGVMFGGSGTFKSFLAIDLALHVAHGLPWLGRKTKPGTVLFIAAEGGSGVWRRIVAWHRERHLKWDAAPIYVLPIAVDLKNDAALVAEAASRLGVTPALVVIDTLAQTFSGEENSAAEISTYLRELGLWFRAAWQAAVLVVHHTGHQATERPRGSSAIRANVDCMFGVHRDEAEMIATLECIKQKDGELFEPQTFTLKVVELAKDEDGDPITSLVARALKGKDAILDVMRHEAGRGRGGRNQLFVELARNGIEEKQLRTLFTESIEGDALVRRQAYHRAKKWAADAGIIEIAQGVVIRSA